MAAMPIYGKNLQKYSKITQKSMTLNVGMQHRYSRTSKFVQMMTLSWPWPILRQGQIWSIMLLYGKKVKLELSEDLTIAPL